MKTVPGVAGADAIGGYVKQYLVEPDPARLIGYGISFSQLANAIEANNVSRGANYIERNGEGYVVRTSGRVQRLAQIAEIAVATGPACRYGSRTSPKVTVGREPADRQRERGRPRVVLGTVLMLVGGNSRTVAAAADMKLKTSTGPCPQHPGQGRPQSHGACGRDRTYGGDKPHRGRPAGRLHSFPGAEQFSRRCHHGDGHSDHDARHSHWHVAGQA